MRLPLGSELVLGLAAGVATPTGTTLEPNANVTETESASGTEIGTVIAETRRIGTENPGKTANHPIVS